jgi:hypothetical protein
VDDAAGRLTPAVHLDDRARDVSDDIGELIGE